MKQHHMRFAATGNTMNLFAHKSTTPSILPSKAVSVLSFDSKHQQQPRLVPHRPPQHCPFVTRARLLMLLLMSVSFTLVLVAQCLYPAIAPAVFYVCWNEQRRRIHPGARDRSGPVSSSSSSSTSSSASSTSSSSSSSELDSLPESVRHRFAKRRLPQCLIIGVRKGGTRALLEFLNLHPSIQAHKQEVHFFDDDHNYSLGLDWYRSRMPYSYPNQITIEKTPAYFVVEPVPSRVYRMNSSLKLLLIVRDPVDRAISDYMQIHSSRLNRGKYHMRFEDLAIHPVTGEVNRSYKAIRRSIYHRHMAMWLRYFPLDQFHFVSGENLVRSPMEELMKVEEFLGIDHKLSRNHFYFNKTRGFFCMRVDQQEKCLASSKGRAHPEIRSSVTTKLRRFFTPHNLRFYEMVGLNFGWTSN